MKIADEIRSTFSSEVQKATVNILFTYNWINGLHAEALKPLELTIQQFNVLRILKGQEPKPASVKLIAERMIDKNSNASRLVDKLLLKKLVERKHCKHDRRQVDIALTTKGKAILEEASKKVNRVRSNFKLNEEDAAQLSTLLDKMRG